jgi:hypothetical protein
MDWWGDSEAGPGVAGEGNRGGERAFIRVSQNLSKAGPESRKHGFVEETLSTKRIVVYKREKTR